MHAILTAAWFGLIAYACWFACGLLVGVLVERRRQSRTWERQWLHRSATRRREYRVVLEREHGRIMGGSKL